MSTGISYALIDKTAEDKMPLVMIGYGRTDAVDGSVFPYAFPLVTTYQMQASAIVKYLATRTAARWPARRSSPVPRLGLWQGAHRALQAEPSSASSSWCRFRWPTRATSRARSGCDPPGEPDYVIFWGWGVMNQTALKAAQKVGFRATR
jgi:branched-chain amino acid transport system substrate-binding protein